jgi:hypothetical protein
LVVVGPRLRGDDSGLVRAEDTSARRIPASAGTSALLANFGLTLRNVNEFVTLAVIPSGGRACRQLS